MGGSFSSLSQQGSSISIVCRLVVESNGSFAGLVPAEFHLEPAEGRKEACNFTKKLVPSVLGKGFNTNHHRLKTPGVPEGNTDFGIHSSLHNERFNGFRLSAQQVDQIRRCPDTFTLKVDLTDFNVLVGSPSNDKATGVIGYVGLLITKDSLPEYNRAIAVYGGKVREGNIPHVSVCGWEFKGLCICGWEYWRFSTSQARAAFGLITEDGETYPDGERFYKANVFPSMKSPQALGVVPAMVLTQGRWLWTAVVIILGSLAFGFPWPR